MLTINDDIIKNIRIKYGTEHPNESFVDDILCNIVDDDNYELCGITLPFCNENNVKEFWKKNLQKENYIHLFPYLVLQLWHRQNKELDSLESWIESFEKDFSEDIITEISFFLDNATIFTQLPPLYVVEIGYIIDCFNWKAKRCCPHFTLYAKNHNLFSDDLYGKYVLLYMESLESYNKNSPLFSIQLLLTYCSLTDILINKNNCFLSVAEKLSGLERDTSDLSTMLSSIPHEQCNLDTYKNIIVFFCENYNVYKGDTNISLCCNSDEIAFWKSNASSYGLVLAYFTIIEWYNENNNSIILKNWIDILSDGDDMALLEKQMKSLKSKFIEQHHEYSKGIIEKVGYLIEAYFWNHYNEVPSLLSSVVISPNGIENYKKLLFEKVKNNFCDFQANVTKYLQFCLFLDTKASFTRYNFLEMLELTCNKESERIANLLEIYPYYGDDFGLTLLKFCNDNRLTYNLSKQAVKKYKFHLFLDSWMCAISDRMGEYGRPYNVELCKQSSSHKKIIDFLNNRHPILWNECNQKSKEIVNKIRGEKLTDKRSPVEERVKDMTKELTNREDRLLSGCLKPLIKEALKEGVQNFIIETESLAKNKGKKIPLLEDVSNTIYDYLIRQYLNFDVSEFPGDTGVLSGLYGDKVARIWIRRYMIGDDEVSWESSLSSEKIAGAKIAFDYYIWNNIYDHVIAWCEQNYGKKDPEEVNYSSDNYDGNDQDDYGIYRGGNFM